MRWVSPSYLIWALLIYALEWAYLPFYFFQTKKQLEQVHSMYFFNGQTITYQTYTDYFARHLEILIPVWIFSKLDTNLKTTAITFKWMLVGYLVDYVLTYNQPVGWFYFIPLSYGLWMGICMAALTIREILRQ